ncbi:MAG: hypothetical protein HUU60_06770 [Armatimonadetes bacterium]|nr:hypothetical protein [Armatimonadota bacterium]
MSGNGSQIKIELAEEEARVEPGGAAQIAVLIRNLGEQRDQVSLEVEGLDTEWCAIPVPSVGLEPGAESREKILIRPPRSSESRAGVYPFVIKARSLENGQTELAQANLVINPYNLLTLELDPKRQTMSYFKPEAEFEARLQNLGNTEQNLQLFANEPEDECVFEFETERAMLKPGESSSVYLRARSVNRPVIAPTKLFGFTVSARSVDNPYLSATFQGQLERRSLISPSGLVALLLLLLIPLIGYFMRPQPVEIMDFAISPETVVAGEKVEIRWQARNADRLVIEPEPGLITDRSRIRFGSFEFVPNGNTTIKITAENRYGRITKEYPITVTAAPPPAAPEIVKFAADVPEVYAGEPVQLQFSVKNATTVIISPPGQQIDPDTPIFEHRPTKTTEYSLRAKNTAGLMAEKKLTVKVLEPTDARIVRFEASTLEINEGETVRLSWEALNAATVIVEPSVNNNDPIGFAEVSPKKTTKYKLIAVDSGGRQTKPSYINIVVKAKVESPITTPNPPGGH